jgi:hypothetical protein
LYFPGLVAAECNKPAAGPRRALAALVAERDAPAVVTYGDHR